MDFTEETFERLLKTVSSPPTTPQVMLVGPSKYALLEVYAYAAPGTDRRKLKRYARRALAGKSTPYTQHPSAA